MVIKQLKVKNIASIEDAVLDFTSKPLNDAHIFLITGNVGTGRTTLLDAMCLALYGTTPSLRNEQRRVPVGDSQYDATYCDPRHLLRRGSREAKVELSFADGDGNNYTACWSTGLCRDNTYKEVRRTLQTSTGTLVDILAEQRICEVVGMDFDEFCRVTMLAQGHFAKFLKSTEDEKSVILEQLMHTDKFTNVGAMVAKMCASKRDALKQQNLRVEAYSILSDDRRKEMREEIALMRTTIEQDDSKWKAAHNKLQWLQADTQLHSDESNMKAHLAKLVESRTTKNFQDEERFIAEWRLTNEARVWYKELERAMQQREVLSLSLNEATIRYDELMSGYMSLNEWIRNAGVALGQLEQEHAVDKNNIKIYDNISAVQMQLEAVTRYQADEQKLKQEDERLLKMLPLVKKEVDTASQKLKSADDDMQRQQQRVLHSKGDYQSLHPETLASEERRLAVWLQYVSDAERMLFQVEEKITRCDDLLGKQQECSKRISVLEGQMLEQGHRVEESYAVVQEVKRLYEITRINVGNEARALRAQLKVGDHCPVCGAQIEKLLAEEELMRAFEPFRYNCEEKERFWNEAQQLYGVQKRIYENLKNMELPCLQNELLQAQQELVVLHQQTIQACRKINIDIPEPTHAFVKSCLNIVFDQRQQCLQQHADLVQRQANVCAMQQTLNEQEHELTEYTDIRGQAQNAFNAAVLRLENIEVNRQLIDSQLSKNTSLMDDTRKALNAVFGNGFWFAEWEKNPEGYIAWWLEKTKVFNDRHHEIEYRNDVLTTNMMVMVHVDKFIKDVQTLFPAWVRRPISASHHIDELDEHWATLAFNVANIAANDKELSHRIDTLQAQLRVFSSEHPEVNIGALLNYSQQNFDSINALHIESDKQYMQSLGILEAVRQHIATHATLRPVDLQGNETVQYLQRVCDELKRRRDDMNSQCGKIQCRLDEDDENRKLVERERLASESLRTDFNKWKVLYNIVGTSNGEKFRHIAQSYLLDTLLRGANEHLQVLNKRYRLSHIPDTLGLCLVDTYQPGVQTPVEQLNNADVVMVSLALSLAMASVGRYATDIDTLFIDEDFGKLDSVEMARVLDMLRSLQQSQNKRLGVISHIDYLAKSIPIHVEASHRDAGCSMIKVVETKGR